MVAGSAVWFELRKRQSLDDLAARPAIASSLTLPRSCLISCIVCVYWAQIYQFLLYMSSFPFPMANSRLMALLIGISLLTLLFQRIGWGTVFPILAYIGWQFLWVGCYFLLPIALAGQAWRTLFAKNRDRGFWTFLLASWIGLACNWLLPVAQIGGELVKARLLAKPNEDIEPWATMVIDKTFQVLTQICFAPLGLVLLMFHRWDKAVFIGGGLAMLILLAMVIFLLRIQKRGLFAMSSRLLQKMMKQEKSESLSRLSESMDLRVREIYSTPLVLMRAFSWRMAFRFGMAGEIYLIMILMGHPVMYHEAVILESLAQTIRMAAFLIPGGLGVQEGTITLIGASLGIPVSQGLALSLARRARELMVGLPALLAWWILSLRENDAAFD